VSAPFAVGTVLGDVNIKLPHIQQQRVQTKLLAAAVNSSVTVMVYFPISLGLKFPRSSPLGLIDILSSPAPLS
jgi:hypothetical protein